MRAFRKYLGTLWLIALASCLLAAIAPEGSVTAQAVTLVYSVLLAAALIASLLYCIAWLIMAVTGRLPQPGNGSEAGTIESGSRTVKESSPDSLRKLRAARLSWQLPLLGIPLAVVMAAVLRTQAYAGGIAFIICIVAGLVASVVGIFRAGTSRAALGHSIVGLILSGLLAALAVYIFLDVSRIDRRDKSVNLLSDEWLSATTS